VVLVRHVCVCVWRGLRWGFGGETDLLLRRRLLRDAFVFSRGFGDGEMGVERRMELEVGGGSFGARFWRVTLLRFVY